MKKFLTPVKVGLLAVLAATGFFYTVRSVQRGAMNGESYMVYAVLEDVLGLAKRSRVLMAGIEVGYIESIELVGHKARLNLRIKKDVPLYRDASLSKISESLIGDKLITLSPGIDTSHPLGDGGQIMNIYEETGVGAVFQKLNGITGDIGAVTKSLKSLIGDMERNDSIGGIMKRMNEIADNVTVLTERVNDTVLRGSAKIDQILGDIAGVTAGTRSRYNVILDDIHATSSDLRKLVNNLNDIVGQGGNDWKESVGGIKETLEKVNRSLDNLDHISRKVNEGQGTLGRLVNDDKLLDKAEGVLDDVSSVTGKLAHLRTEIDLRTEFHIREGALKNYLALRLIPKSDKYYMFEVIDDPRGSVKVEKTCINPEDCRNGGTENITVTDDFKFSLEFFKRYYFLGLRFGIIENTGGLGANLFFLNDDLEFKLDLFQFGTNEFGEDSLPRLKVMMMYRPSWLANHVYLAAGGDDFLSMASNGHDTFDYFFGAGLHFDDEDLKSIFTAVGVPSVP